MKNPRTAEEAIKNIQDAKAKIAATLEEAEQNHMPDVANDMRSLQESLARIEHYDSPEYRAELRKSIAERSRKNTEFFLRIRLIFTFVAIAIAIVVMTLKG